MPRPKFNRGLAARDNTRNLLDLAKLAFPQRAERDRIGRGAERGHRVPWGSLGRSDSCLRHTTHNSGQQWFAHERARAQRGGVT